MMRKKEIIISAATLILATISVTYAENIFVLGDDYSEDFIIPYLESQGHTVTDGGIYYDWDGTDSSGAEYDAAILLYGYDYGSDMTTKANDSLVTFVENGGTLITTEWLLYSIDDGSFTGSLIDILPVTYGDAYSSDSTWDVDESSPLTDGIYDGWYDGAGFSYTITNPGTTVVADDGSGNALLSYNSNAANGHVVHINHDMAYDITPLSEGVLGLINNAVNFSEGTSVIPEPASLGMIGMIFGGLYFVRRIFMI